MADENVARDWRRAVGALAFASILTAVGVMVAVALVISVTAVLGSSAVRLVAGTGDGDVVAQSRLESRADEFSATLERPTDQVSLSTWGEQSFASDDEVTATLLSVERGDRGAVTAVVKMVARVSARTPVGFGDPSWDQGYAESCYRFVALPTGRTLADVVACPPR